MAVARVHPLCSLVAFFLRIFPRCRVSKKAAGSESRTRKIHRSPRHWRSCSILTPPIEGTLYPGKQSSRSFPLSSRIFPPLSYAPLVLVFSFSPSPSIYLAVATPPPPRFLLLLRHRVLARLHLGPLSSYLARTSVSLLRRRRRRYHRSLRALASSLSFSTFSSLLSLALLFPRPASFLFFGVGFAGAPGAPRTPPGVSSEMVSSFPLLLPRVSVLPLATLRYGIRRPGRNPASGVRLRSLWKQRRKGGFQRSLRRRFLRY